MIVYFHMGAHKTASSLIQHRLRRVGGRIAGRHFVFMDNNDVLSTPWADWCRRKVGNHGIAEQSFTDQVAKWQSEKADTIILSSEGFLGGISVFENGKLYPTADNVMARLKSLVDAADNAVEIRPVYYVRQTDRYLESCLSQRLSLGKAHDLETVFTDKKLAALSWRPVVSAIEETFCKPIAVRLFEDLKILGPADFVGKFLTTCGLSEPGLIDRYVTLGRGAELLPKFARDRQPVADFLRPNAGLSVRGSEMALRLRPLVSKQEWRATVRPFIRRHFSALNDTGRGVRVPPDIAKQLQQTYREDCTWLGDRLTLLYDGRR